MTVIKTCKETKDKAEDVFDRYVKAMWVTAASAPKLKSEAMKKPSAVKKQTVADDYLIKSVRESSVDRWDNDDGSEAWYDETIVSIDYEHRTAHSHFDDDVIDDSVP